jgi:hypothetical protein
MFIGDEHDFCATLAYILGANYGEANFPDGNKHSVVMYKGWVCQPGIAPNCADNLAKTAKITVTFPIRNAAACKALGYELLIQGK